MHRFKFYSIIEILYLVIRYTIPQSIRPFLPKDFSNRRRMKSYSDSNLLLQSIPEPPTDEKRQLEQIREARKLFQQQALNQSQKKVTSHSPVVEIWLFPGIWSLSFDRFSIPQMKLAQKRTHCQTELAPRDKVLKLREIISIHVLGGHIISIQETRHELPLKLSISGLILDIV